jgi:hypothetical protein
MSYYERQNSKGAVIELLPSSEQVEAASRWQDLEHSMRNTGLTNSWSWTTRVEYNRLLVSPENLDAFAKNNQVSP